MSASLRKDSAQARQFKCFLNENDMKVPPKCTNSATFFHFNGKDTSQIDLLGLRFGLLFLDFCCCSVQLYKISCSSFTTLSMLHFAIGWFISCKVVIFASTLLSLRRDYAQDRLFKCFLNESDMKVPPKYTNSATFFHFNGKDTSQNIGGVVFSLIPTILFPPSGIGSIKCSYLL
jgi:hypothetical protein